MARDFIPVARANTAPIRGPEDAPSTQLQPWVNRDRNVLYLSDGEGGITAMARPRGVDQSIGPYDAVTAVYGRGLARYKSNWITVTESTYYYNGGNTTITGGNDFADDICCSFVSALLTNTISLVTVNPGGPSINVSETHGNVWHADSPLLAPTRLTDADMPGNNGVSLIRGGAYLDGYLFLADIYGQIHNSSLNNMTTWAAADYLTAEKEYDIGVYLGRHRDNLFYLGSRSIEFFYNAGNASGSPLAVRQDISYNVGCDSPNAVAVDGDTVYFLGISPEHKRAIYKLENFQLTKISNRRVEYFLMEEGSTLSIDDIETAGGHNAKHLLVSAYHPYAGRVLYLTINQAITLTYFVELGLWGEFSLGGNLTASDWFTNTTDCFPVSASAWPPAFDTSGTVMLANGATVAFNDPTTSAIDDLGEGFNPESYIMLMPWDAGTGKTKRINSIRVIGYPLAHSSHTPANVTLAWEDLNVTSANGIQNTTDFTNTRTIDMSVTGGRIYRCGSTRQRVFKLGFSDSGIANVAGLEIEYEVVE